MFKDFSYKAYRSILKSLLRERENVCFEDLASGDDRSRYFILRHDIDYSPESALSMAEIEAEMGVRASYFLMFSSLHYNLLSEYYCRFPRRLVELGHEIGLHYDLRCYEYLGKNRLSKTLHNESEMLENLAGKRVRSISMHEPSISGKDLFRNHKDFINAYDDQYTKKMPYFSDSCGVWSDEALLALQGENLPLRFQLLIHPFFWREEPVDRWTVLEKFIEEKTEKLEEFVRQRKEMWVRLRGVGQHNEISKTV